MRRIRWTTMAADDLEAAVSYVQQDQPEAARELARTVLERVEQLVNFPGSGRPGEVKGTRELVIASYVAVYRYTNETIEILHIWHGAQDWR